MSDKASLFTVTINTFVGTEMIKFARSNNYLGEMNLALVNKLNINNMDKTENVREKIEAICERVRISNLEKDIRFDRPENLSVRKIHAA